MVQKVSIFLFQIIPYQICITFWYQSGILFLLWEKVSENFEKLLIFVYFDENIE